MQTVTEKLIKVEPLPPAVIPADDPLAMLGVAVKNGASVETLERLMALRDKMMAEKRRESYYQALAAFQAEMPIVVKSSAVVVNGQTRYRYAPIDKIVRIAGPLLAKHGFSYHRDSKIEAQTVEAIITVTHRDGHSEVTAFRVPFESSAAMSPAQKYASALTFADRYAFCGALGIKTGDEDTDLAEGIPDDGAALKAAKRKLWEILEPIRGTEQNWKLAFQWLIDECCIPPDSPAISKMTVAELTNAAGKAAAKLK